MKERGLLARAGRAVLRLALIELGIVAALLAVALLSAQHERDRAAADAGGAFIFAFGPFSLLGGWGTTRNWVYLYAHDGGQHRRAPSPSGRPAGGTRAGLFRPRSCWGS